MIIDWKCFVHFYVPTHHNRTHPDLEGSYLNPTRKFLIPTQSIISKLKKSISERTDPDPNMYLVSIPNWLCKQIKSFLLTGLNSCRGWTKFIQTYGIIMVNTKNKQCKIIMSNYLEKNAINKVVKMSENKERKDVINLLKIVLVLFCTSILIK